MPQFLIVFTFERKPHPTGAGMPNSLILDTRMRGTGELSRDEQIYSDAKGRLRASRFSDRTLAGRL
jgi:hypothetical protein